MSWFQNLFDARAKISAWRTEYNEQRPHTVSAIAHRRSSHGSKTLQTSPKLVRGKRTQTPSPCPTPPSPLDVRVELALAFVFRNVRSEGEGQKVTATR